MIDFYERPQTNSSRLSVTTNNSIPYNRKNAFEVNALSNPEISQIGFGTQILDPDVLESKSNGPNDNIMVARPGRRVYDQTKVMSDITATSESGAHLDFTKMMDEIRTELYLPTSDFSYYNEVKKLTQRYNRFKLPNHNIEIKRGFGHVFFIKPMCNLTNSTNTDLLDNVKSEGAFDKIYQQNPYLINEICSRHNNNDIMYLLSNYAKGFSLNDEELQSATYGNTYTGYKISYGKTNIESKTAGSFSVTFNDDKTLSIYKIHRMWTDYINAVYRGRLDPEMDSIANKILDYVGAVYYILTAEDNETILFWSKYYGVYPTTIPSSQYSWSAGSAVDPQQITIQYNYSWKEDYSIAAIAEFNTNSRIASKSGSTPQYDPLYSEKLGHAGPTIVGTPYIDEVHKESTGSKSLAYTDKTVFKLRFLPSEITT